MQEPTHPGPVISRRAAVATTCALLVSGIAVIALGPRRAMAQPWLRRATHPDPRPGITAAKVLPDDAVPARYRDAYAAAREIPEILDGLFCHCDCADHCGYRSLLTCYEHDMPQSCGICLGEARTARRLHGRGETLAQIRVAIDRAYGGAR